MKAIRVTCPNCGATLGVPHGATTVTCEYCGTPSAVQRRTQFLERVVRPQATNLPRAVQRHSKAWVVFALLMGAMPFVIGGIIAYKVTREVKKATSSITISSSATKSSRTSVTIKTSNGQLSWQGTDNVLVGDVDGDGRPELVGRGRRVNAGDIVMLIALDLATGKVLWESAPIGTYSDTYRGFLALAGDTLLYAGNDGTLRGFALRDGKALWSTKLDERIEYFCAPAEGDASIVDAVGADDVIRPITRATGAIGTTRPAPKKPRRHPRQDDSACTRLPSDSVSHFDVARKAEYEKQYAIGKKLGLYVDAIIRGPGGRVLGGAREKGTRVTTIVALDDANNERWRASPDGLVAEGAPRTIVVGDRETCILYYGKEYRTACYALADGKRLWDVPAPSFFEDLVIIGRTLVVTGNELRVHDLDTGNVRWTY